MKTGAEYLSSLRDGRSVYLQGTKVEDVTTHPGLREAAEWVADGYDRFHSGEAGAFHPMYDLPRSAEDLRRRMRVLQESDFTASTSAVGLALLTAAPSLAKADPVYALRAKDYFEHARAEDLRMAEVITDAKGNRALPPSAQDDPDLYLRVVERSSEGLVVSGAKFHITGGPVVHELVVMPTKRMKAGEGDYAVAFAVPANAPGVTMISTSYAPKGDDVRHYPVSGRFSMPEAMVVFDRVLVPWDRVFLDGEVAQSAVLAHSLGLWERLSGIADMAHLADLLVGAAQLVAEYNGTAGIAHIREKIAEMAIYATMVRASLEAALTHSEETEDGMVFPSELFTNAGKFYGASEDHLMVRHLHDIAGASVITAPTMADLDNPDLNAYISKYLRTMEGVDAERRMRVFHLIRDLTADALGGWHQVANIQSGGGLFAQRLVAKNHYDIDHARGLAMEAAGIAKGGE